MSVLQPNLVSIIVRTHRRNNLFLFEETLKSIKNNVYRPIEIVVVAQTKDDLLISTINQLIDSLNDNLFSIKLVINRTDQDERAKNLNLGIAQATGRYIGFLDDDDIYYPKFIASLLQPYRIPMILPGRMVM
ncbi:MAG: glycosyltransferase family 2 protein [Leptolyngbyaceae cyanobacterium SM2_5_2]|nr:glycosyltransferase family 2 protein [Leptolyngbyaceae cyanobacterium SM2_5_2]